MYKKARAGIIPNFTGVSAPYDEPKNALEIDTGVWDLNECMRVLQKDMFEKTKCIKDNNGPRPVVATLVNA
jgi:adenylylsulfate kinase-like enzyme